MAVTEQLIFAMAPNANAAENGRKLSKGGKFSAWHKTADASLYWANCAGSGKKPYSTSVDWSNPEAPVCRCSCPSRQFPCKHALGLLFEILGDKPFEVADIPPDIAEKRAKQTARAEKKATEAAKPKKVNAAAQAKKVKRQLEGLEMAEKMVNNLLTAGIGTLSGSSVKSYEKLAKDLGSYYLTGPQTSFTRIAAIVREIQDDSQKANQGYAEALRILIALHSTIKKSRVFLEQKLEAGQYSAEDTVLFEALGGVWKLTDLHSIGAYRENARLVQLSFDVSYDDVKREYIERGYWLDIDNGCIDYTVNLRPTKALKFIQADDSRFDLLEVPVLYTYPGEGNRRIRWDSAIPQPVPAGEQARFPTLAQPTLAAAIKLVKGQIKNTLLPKYMAALVPCARVGRVQQQTLPDEPADTFVLEDAAGTRIVLRDRPEDGDDHACTRGLACLPEAIPAGSALFGLLFFDNRDHRICLHPYSVVTPQQIIRLQY